MTTTEQLADRVRVRLRTRGANVDAVGIRLEAEAVVEESLSEPGLMGASDDAAEQLVRDVVDRLAGLGPLQRLMDDPEIEEIWVNDPGHVFVARRGEPELTSIVLDDGAVIDLVERLLRSTGRRVDLSSPFVDATLADGSRLHVVIPDITRSHPAINIRKFVLPAANLGQLVALGSMPNAVAELLRACVSAGLNIIVAGGTQAGKTTLLSSLVAAIPPRERVITCEEVFEIRSGLPDVVALQTRPAGLDGTGEVRLRRLVVEALRMRPDRLIVGEVRQEECLDLLIALNSGLPGMCSLHANSARDAITKLTTLPLLAGANVSHAFVVPTVASCVDIVVHVGKDGQGRRRVNEVVAVHGRVEAGVIAIDPLVTWSDSGYIRGRGALPHPERLQRCGLDPVRLVGAL